jgi:hypothetical protein
MVNIRASLGRAEAQAVIGASLREKLEAFAKSLFYKERTIDRLLNWASAMSGKPFEIEQLRCWLTENSVDLMREDAETLLKKVKAHICADPAPLEVSYKLEPARSWLNALSCARGTVPD